MKRILLSLLALFATCAVFAHSVTEEDSVYCVSHSWKYKSDTWSCALKISKELYAHYKSQRVHQSNHLAGFALSDYDRECLRDLVRNFREAGKQSHYSDYDNVYNVVAFVQSFRYVSDLESTGQKEYVRYPVETLVDGVGDCEDTSILIAAILREMGYGVVLLSLPNHVALGLKGDNTLDGTYYLYENQRYYYLETTDKGWKLGEVPKAYKQSSATVLPLKYAPQVTLKSFELKSFDSDSRSVAFRIVCKAENTGPGATSGAFLRVMAYQKGHPVRMLEERFFDVDDLVEAQQGEYLCSIRVPRIGNVVFELQMSGVNFESNTLKSRDLNLK